MRFRFLAQETAGKNSGSITLEWLDGGHFIIEHSQNDHEVDELFGTWATESIQPRFASPSPPSPQAQNGSVPRGAT